MADVSGHDASQSLVVQIEQAYHDHNSLNIVGGGSKAFYGRHTQGDQLNTTPHHGIINYQPTELVITARAGTRLSDIEKILRENKQMLGFEPPGFSPDATLGGMTATRASGRRG